MNLSEIKLKNFKSFEKLELSLSNLNILCGSNSVGKSSVIQALLLFKQNIDNISIALLLNYNEVKRFSVNGDWVELGDENGLLFLDAIDDELSITLSEDSKQYMIEKPGRGQCWVTNEANKSAKGIKVPGCLIRLRYLSTNRISPKITYGLSQHDIHDGSIGSQGEFTAHFLAEKKHEEIGILSLTHPKSVTSLLLENVSFWLAEISENVEVYAKVIPEANQAAITYKYSYGNNQTRELNPLNVGFGVTHVLPVITMLLTAKPGELLVIENPEAQLHPKGQAGLAKLLALAAANGVQVIIETHSDHIVNGVRVATKQGVIKPSDSKIYFFHHEIDSLATTKTEISIAEDGTVDKWPKGFFDEWDNQLDKLLW